MGDANAQVRGQARTVSSSAKGSEGKPALLQMAGQVRKAVSHIAVDGGCCANPAKNGVRQALLHDAGYGIENGCHAQVVDNENMSTLQE
jgi:hypothetical protein